MRIVKSFTKLFRYKRIANINRKRDDNREIGIITYVFLTIFIALIVYIGLFTGLKSADVINNPYNKRQALLEERLVRGNILSKNGQILATTYVDDEGICHRYYPYKNVFAHVVGYSTHGVLGIESIENFKMLECNDNIAKRIKNDFSGIKNNGNSVITTLNVKVQQAAYDALGDRKGAVIVMNAKTGEILALVSKPDFDPNLINEDWDRLNDENGDSPLLNRAVMGQYPPGSTFKIVTALEYIKERKGDISEYEYDCNGSFKKNGSVVNCYHQQRHGEVDLNLSFAKSCNSSFANMAATLDKEKFEDTCNELLFNSDMPLPFVHGKGSTDITVNSTFDDVLQTGIGQGRTITTPAHIMLITAAIANDGMLMKPYVVDGIANASGKIIKKTSSREYMQLIEPRYADILKELMRDVVVDGTATRLKDTTNYIAGGKTGSAEYSADKSRSHAWFTGYAQNDDECIVATVIVEDGGSGGEVSAPIAKRVFDAYYY